MTAALFVVAPWSTAMIFIAALTADLARLVLLFLMRGIWHDRESEDSQYLCHFKLYTLNCKDKFGSLLGHNLLDGTTRHNTKYSGKIHKTGNK